MEDPIVGLKPNKKKIVYIVVAAVLVIVIAIGIAITVRNISNNTVKQPSAVKTTKEQALDLKSQALKAKENSDATKAKALFEQAKEKFEAAGDTNNVIDMQAQIYLIDHK